MDIQQAEALRAQLPGADGVTVQHTWFTGGDGVETQGSLLLINVPGKCYVAPFGPVNDQSIDDAAADIQQQMAKDIELLNAEEQERVA